MDREWATRLRLVAFEDYTVESIETVGTSQPKVAIRGLCQRCNYTRRLQAIPSPLEAIEVSSPDEVKRSRRKIRR